MKIVERILLTCPVLWAMLAGPNVIASEDSPPTPMSGQSREDSKLSRSGRTYDERFTHRKDVFTKDPYIWVYSESFAKDFHMPEQWIDKELQGADALAFRTGVSFPLCGWSGKRDLCKPTMMCLVEMYFNHVSHPLPWNERLRWTDLQINITSASTLNSMRALSRRSSKEVGRLSPFADKKNGNELDWWFIYVSKEASGGGPSWHAYDRSVFDDYSLVVLDTRCSNNEVAALELRAYRSVDPNGKVFHSVSFPKSWRDRVMPSIRQVREEESTFFRNRFEELGRHAIGR